ncbi:hypothetical protein AB1N83_012145 [Pleurotus pulmonarius]
MRNSRPGCFAFLILLYNWWNESLVAHASEVNVTVDDADPSILYVPSGSWHSNSVPCTFCLEPDSALAYQKTFHDGTHIIPTVDGDDMPSSSSSQVPRPSSTGRAVTSSATSRPPASSTRPTSQSPLPTTQTTTQVNDDGDDDDADDDHGNDGPSHTRRQEAEFNPFATSKFDADDPEFVDQPVFVQYNFTGTAIYIYCLLPEAAAPPNTMPTTVNLTFTLDDQTFDPYRHTGDSSKSGFLSNVNVFFADGLANAPHTVRVDIGPNSVFLFDYLVYTQVRSTGDAESSNSDNAEKHHNIATFAGAVGGSVGVLAIFAAGLAISIYYRRVRSARRLRRERDNESLHTEGSEDSPRMYGPAPFVPRYFPGTVPTAPPPYIPTTSRSSLSSPDSSPASPYSPLMSSASSIPVTMTYADLPPALPLRLEDVLLADDVPPVPPPSFGEAIASPLRIPLALPPPPGIPSPVLSSISNSSIAPGTSEGVSNGDPPLSSPPPFTPSESQPNPPAFSEVESSSRTPESRPPSRGSITDLDHEVGIAR